MTGPIGSGKSAVGRGLAALGFDTLDADAIGHDVLNGPGFADVAARWPEVATGDRIDRRLLAAIVFTNSAALTELEAFLHPLIVSEIQSVSDRVGDRPLVVEVSVPAAADRLGWPVLMVEVETDTRLDRLLSRGMLRSDALRRMAAQPNPEAWREAADYIVSNQGDIETLMASVVRLLDELGWEFPNPAHE